jgi:hypothetical protein
MTRVSELVEQYNSAQTALGSHSSKQTVVSHRVSRNPITTDATTDARIVGAGRPRGGHSVHSSNSANYSDEYFSASSVEDDEVMSVPLSHGKDAAGEIEHDSQYQGNFHRSRFRYDEKSPAPPPHAKRSLQSGPSSSSKYTYRPALTSADIDDIELGRALSPSYADPPAKHKSSIHHQREPSSSSTIRSSSSSPPAQGKPPNPVTHTGWRAAHALPHRSTNTNGNPSSDESNNNSNCANENRRGSSSTTVSDGRSSDRSMGRSACNQESGSDDEQPLFEIGRAPAALRSKPLPKAKVVIARRRPDSVDFGVQGVPESSPNRAAMSTPAHQFDELYEQPPTRKLVTDYSDPMELRRGRVSLINLMDTNCANPDDDDSAQGQGSAAMPGGGSAVDCGRKGGMHGTSGKSAHSQRSAASKNTDFMDADGLGRQISVNEVYGQGPVKRSYKPSIFGGRPANAEDEKSQRHAAREEAINRRSTFVSGAIDRISIAADPFVDFITNANVSAPAPPRGRFSRFMQKFMGRKYRQAIKA